MILTCIGVLVFVLVGSGAVMSRSDSHNSMCVFVTQYVICYKGHCADLLF